MRQLGYEASSDLVVQRLSRLSRGEDAVLVAEANGLVVGVISLHTCEMFHADGRLGRITSLVVDRSHRGASVGKLLVQAADAYFLRDGCVRAEVTSGDHRPQAHAFYQGRGYALDERRFVKRYAVPDADRHSESSTPVMPMRPDPSLHPTCYSRLRLLPPAGELER